MTKTEIKRHKAESVYAAAMHNFLIFHAFETCSPWNLYETLGLSLGGFTQKLVRQVARLQRLEPGN